MGEINVRTALMSTVILSVIPACVSGGIEAAQCMEFMYERRGISGLIIVIEETDESNLHLTRHEIAERHAIRKYVRLSAERLCVPIFTKIEDGVIHAKSMYRALLEKQQEEKKNTEVI